MASTVALPSGQTQRFMNTRMVSPSNVRAAANTTVFICPAKAVVY